MGFFGSLMKFANPLGGVIGAIANQKAQNRGEKFAGQMDLEQLLLEREGQRFDQGLRREQDVRTSGLDAFRRMLMAQHTREPGPRPQLSPYSVAPRNANEHERIAAEAMADEVANRLINGYQGPSVSTRPSGVDPRLLDPGKFEKTASWLAPILGFGRR